MTCNNFISISQPHGVVLVRDYAIGDFAQVSILVPFPYLPLNLIFRSIYIHIHIYFTDRFIVSVKSLSHIRVRI